MSVKGIAYRKKGTNISIYYDTGEVENGLKLKRLIENEYESNDYNKVYKYKKGKEIYHIPQTTAIIIKTNSNGVLLSDTKCVNCGKNVMMKLTTIRDQDVSTCPVCKKNLY